MFSKLNTCLERHSMEKVRQKALKIQLKALNFSLSSFTGENSKLLFSKAPTIIYGRYGIMRKEYFCVVMCALWRPQNLLHVRIKICCVFIYWYCKGFFMYFNILLCCSFTPFLLFSSVESWMWKFYVCSVLKKREYKFFFGIWRFIVCVLKYGMFCI